MVGMNCVPAGSVLTSGSSTFVCESWYERPTRDNCENEVFRMNSDSGELKKIEPPIELRVKRFSSSTLRKSSDDPKRPCCASTLLERNVPSPKYFCENAKTEKPAVMGRFLIYGSVNENWNDRCRLPYARLKARVSPRPRRLLVEYSSPKNEPPMPERPPLNEICWRPRSATFRLISTRASSSSVRKSASRSASSGSKKPSWFRRRTEISNARWL